jgi:hypothetical protein
MSRAYRIEVKESEKRTIRASDEIGTSIELLEIVSPEETAELLVADLKKRGFKDNEGKLVRESGKTTITVDPCQGEVVIRSSQEVNSEKESTQTGVAIDDIRGSGDLVTNNLKEKAHRDIDKKFEREQTQLQTEISTELEQAVRDFQPELQDIINQVTKEALKKKAGQLGQIREVHEDSTTGGLTITVEV